METFPITSKNEIIHMDQIKSNILFDKLKPAFKENGKITLGNSPSLSDGAAMIILSSRTKATEMN